MQVSVRFTVEELFLLTDALDTYEQVNGPQRHAAEAWVKIMDTVGSLSVFVNELESRPHIDECAI